MNDLVRALLPALQTAAGRALRPEDLDTLIVHNTGAVPPVRRTATSGVGSPGFNVIVAECGEPIFICKCRPAGDPALSHEATIGGILGRDPSTASHVAASHLDRGEKMDVLVVRRLPGEPYHELLDRQNETEWISSVELVIGLVERMAARVAESMPALRGPRTVRIAEEARWALDALKGEQRLTDRRAELLWGALSAGGEVTANLQHGDLWPPNVLVDGSSWYVIDLELFGRIRVPLYDLLHMLHICSGFRLGEQTAAHWPWVERLLAPDGAEAGPRQLIQRTALRHGLPPSAAFAALVYYVIDATARVKARGAWTGDWRSYLEEASRLADMIDDGTATPNRLFMTGPG